MRLFLLPVSTRRTLIYCQRLNVSISEQQTLIDKGTRRAAQLWAKWEKKDSGWQKKVVDLGNKALKRIPYEEWGLKSIPPLSARRKEDELSGKEKVEVLFPPGLIPQDKVQDVLRILGTEREALHKKRLIGSFIGMPLSAPLALIPVIPNLLFFYLVYRAWSHWRALSGSKHIQFLIDRKLITSKPSSVLDALYPARTTKAAGNKLDTPQASNILSKAANAQTAANDSDEVMVLDHENSKLIAKALEIPELEVELDRAIWQVENVLRGKEELKAEKEELDEATSTTTQTREQDKK